MALVKPHQPGTAPAFPLALLPAVMDEDAGDEALTQPGILEPSFLFDRQMRQPGEERLGKEAAAVLRRSAGALINLHPLHAAGR